MLRKVHILCLVAAVLAGCIGCGRQAPPVPRPQAFPRVELYPELYTRVECGNAAFDINSAAESRSDRPGWLTIGYPRYGAEVFFTVSHFPEGGEALARAVDNRRQRITLNLGDATSDVDAVDSESFHTYIIRSPEVRQMPLQLLATDGRSTLISAAVYFPGAGPSSPLDSLAPAVEAIYRDMVRAAQSFDYE